ncbi:polysaccharide deacetylase family protein [Microbacterium sp. 22195]|uniref:polysaccharide deacetylase family protein n=1 Tax=Microbacterium sp. 22195 TaxID=3453891 RepID=UPI003F84D7C6
MTAHPLPRDLRGYGEHPPEVLWPGGSRVAVSLVINVEDGSERSGARGDDADDLGAHWTVHPAHPHQRNLDLESAFEYGARAGIWRLLRTLRRHDARATAFCCAAALEANPRIAEALVRDGHEIADHGLLWEPHTLLTPDEEHARMVRSREIIEELTGRRPTTWYSRDGLTEHSRSSMIAEGFRYDANSFNDDVPHAGPDGLALPVIPYAGDTNDSALLRQYPTAASFAGHLCDALDMLLDDPREGAGVLSVGLHPRLIGRPAYIGALDALLRRAREKGAWIATREQIAEHWSTAVAA